MEKIKRIVMILLMIILIIGISATISKGYSVGEVMNVSI